MDKQHFDQLVKGVKEMKRHIAGKTVRGAIAAELPCLMYWLSARPHTSARASLPS